MGEMGDFGDDPFELTGDSELYTRPLEHGIVVMEEENAVFCSYEDLGSERSGKYDFEGDDKDRHGGEGDEEDLRRKDDEGGGIGCYDQSCVSADDRHKRMNHHLYLKDFLKLKRKENPIVLGLVILDLDPPNQ